MISGLITHASQCFRSSDKEAAAQSALISNDPVAVAILTVIKTDEWDGGSLSVSFLIALLLLL
jgi:hypothetical protein